MRYQILGLNGVGPPGPRVKDPLNNGAGAVRSTRRGCHRVEYSRRKSTAILFHQHVMATAGRELRRRNKRGIGGGRECRGLWCGEVGSQRGGPAVSQIVWSFISIRPFLM